MFMNTYGLMFLYYRTSLLRRNGQPEPYKFGLAYEWQVVKRVYEMSSEFRENGFSSFVVKELASIYI